MTAATEPQDRPPFRLTLRARLTLLYAIVFFAAGLILLAVNYAVVSRSLDSALPSFVAGVATNPAEAGGVTIDGPGQSSETLPTATAYADRLEVSENQLRGDTLGSLLSQSLLALLLVGIVAAAAAYAIAARTLAPVHAITATARRVASQNLHERIGLTGPRDEVLELAETFDEMLDRLDATFSSQRRFVANASHELRTPLATSRALLEVALADPDAPDQLRAVGDQLLAVNARSERLIEGLLVLARSEHELTETAEVDLAAVVEHAADGLESEFDEAGVTLRQRLGTSVVRGSAALLERLAVNLLQNAARHNVPGRQCGCPHHDRGRFGDPGGEQHGRGHPCRRRGQALRAVPPARRGTAVGAGRRARAVDRAIGGADPWRGGHGGLPAGRRPGGPRQAPRDAGHQRGARRGPTVDGAGSAARRA